MIILLHSSKTMQHDASKTTDYQKPQLQHQADKLAQYVSSLSAAQLGKAMHLSKPMAEKTHALMNEWNADDANTLPAIDVFLGDIYSGLQAHTFSEADRMYANDHLYILSGLYGVLRALDGVMPYRLEMGYRFSKEPYKNLYKFWGDAIAKTLPENQSIINLSAVEYTKAVLSYMADANVISPKFLTVSPKTGEPTFVVVHAKIARGAFARWLIQQKISDITMLKNFKDLGYTYNVRLSTPTEPVFVCKTFGGIGLSVRLRP